jgi:hypothetical protein
VHAWVNAGRWNKTLTGRSTDTSPVPAGINWDLWLGPRQPRPYHPAYTPVTWRDFWQFGTGARGDFGCHHVDAAFWALDLQEPLCVEARPAGNMDDEIAPHGEMCNFHFGPRACSHFGYGAKLTEIVLLGVLSLRAGQRFYWDAANPKARNLPQADALIHGTYRNGWKLG